MSPSIGVCGLHREAKPRHPISLISNDTVIGSELQRVRGTLVINNPPPNQYITPVLPPLRSIVLGEYLIAPLKEGHPLFRILKRKVDLEQGTRCHYLPLPVFVWPISKVAYRSILFPESTFWTLGWMNTLLIDPLDIVEMAKKGGAWRLGSSLECGV
jgi:hypothetical protein